MLLVYVVEFFVKYIRNIKKKPTKFMGISFCINFNFFPFQNNKNWITTKLNEGKWKDIQNMKENC
jgi:hypothetical protein